MTTLIKKHPVVSFVVLTYLINWLGITAMVAGYFPPCGEWALSYEGEPVAEFRGRRTLLVWAPNIAAMIVAMVSGGRQAVAKLMGQFLIWKVARRWWLTAFFLPVLIAVASVGLYMMIGGRIDLSNSHYLIPVFFFRFLFSLSTGGIGEEAGWRGFAQPLLQEKIGALGASALIGVLWAMSHAASWSLRALSWDSIVVLSACLIGMSVVLAWIYNRTGSLLLVALTHMLFNVMEALVSRSPAAVMPNQEFLQLFSIVLIICCFALAIATKGNLGWGPHSAGNDSKT